MKYFKMITVWFTLIFSAAFIFQTELFMYDMVWKYVLPALLVFTITACVISWVVKIMFGAVGLFIDRTDKRRGSLFLMWIADIASIWLALYLTGILMQSTIFILNWWASIIFALCISVVDLVFDLTV